MRKYFIKELIPAYIALLFGLIMFVLEIITGEEMYVYGATGSFYLALAALIFALGKFVGETRTKFKEIDKRLEHIEGEIKEVRGDIKEILERL